MTLLNPKVPPETEAAGSLKAIVLDWAGTTVDFGSLAPVRTIEKLFARVGVHPTEAEIRSGMGLPKRDHIRHIISNPRVGEAWRAAFGHPATSADAEQMYQEFIPLQLSGLAEYSAVIPGVAETVQRFRSRGLKIGSTTGYTRAMLDVLMELSAKEGYTPDCSLTPEDVGAGRPEPFMMYETAVRLRVSPLAAMVKIGDTPADIEEGLNAGAWSIGVAGTGNGIRTSYREFQSLPTDEKQSRLIDSRSELEGAGAHYVVDTLAEVDALLDEINERMNPAKKSVHRSNVGA